MRNIHETTVSFRWRGCGKPECGSHHQVCAYCDDCMHGYNGITHPGKCAEDYRQQQGIIHESEKNTNGPKSSVPSRKPEPGS